MSKWLVAVPKDKADEVRVELSRTAVILGEVELGDEVSIEVECRFEPRIEGATVYPASDFDLYGGS